MANLHAVIAAEPTRKEAYKVIRVGTQDKFTAKAVFFEGQLRTLKMLEESEANAAIEAAARTETALRGGVATEMKFLLDFFVEFEKLQVQKNCTNAAAKADITINGTVFKDIPLHEFLGLKDRVKELRAVVAEAPTLDASKAWEWSAGVEAWVAPPEVTVKGEKEVYGIILSPATDKHPAQVKEGSRDRTTGKFILNRTSRALTAVQKSRALEFIDGVIASIDEARTVANSTDIVEVPNPGVAIMEGLMQRLTDRNGA